MADVGTEVLSFLKASLELVLFNNDSITSLEAGLMDRSLSALE